MALDLRGLEGPEVDIACGVVEPAVDMWEAGTLVPTREQVAALAVLTDFPVTFFYQPADPPLGPVWICRRGRGGCELYDPRPDAEVVQLAETQGRLF